MITTRQAHALITAGVARAHELAIAVNIAVLDAGAHLKGFSRMDGAVLGSTHRPATGATQLLRSRSPVNPMPRTLGRSGFVSSNAAHNCGVIVEPL